MKVENSATNDPKSSEAFDILTNSIHIALSSYSNVHRGSGHYSQATTHLYEEARKIVLGYLDLKEKNYEVVFCSPLKAEGIVKMLSKGSFHILSSEDIGLSIGVRAIAIRKSALPKGAPLYPGGGSARLVSPEWVVWSKAPDRLEAGTPAVINVITFARALRIIKEYGENPFTEVPVCALSAKEILNSDELIDLYGTELLGRLRETLIGKDLRVPTINGLKPYINLDNAASTQTFRPIVNCFTMSLRMSAAERKLMADEARSVCAEFLNAPLSEYEMIFTSNTTESINIAAASLRKRSEDGFITVVLNTMLEHNSNDLPWRNGSGTGVVRMAVDPEGFLDLKELENTLREYNKENKHGKERIRLVSVSGASNVLGTCNDLAEISRIVHRCGAELLVDAAQMIAHRKSDMKQCGIDFFVFSAHKAYAPFGTGVLIAKKDLLMFSQGELDKIKASGEENTAGIAAMVKALQLLQRIGMDIICDEEQRLINHTIKALSAVNGLKLFGISDPESASIRNKTGVISFFIKGVWPDKISKELAANGIGIRYGCHCAHMLVKQMLKVPPSLQKLQHFMAVAFPRIAFPGVARISFGLTTTREEADACVNVLKEIAANHKTEGSVMKDEMDEFTRSVSEKVFGS
jgi:selenocysteine lyase/cysteine desulfurase